LPEGIHDCMRFPDQIGHPFRCKSATIPEEIGHRSGAFRPPLVGVKSKQLATLGNTAVTIHSFGNKEGLDGQHEVTHAQDQRSSSS
jgi:hypothetical protein